MASFTTLQAGGPAEKLAFVHGIDELAAAAAECQVDGKPLTVLGSGSNVLVADAGLAGHVIVNRANRIAVARTGEVLADTGCILQDLFLKTLQAGLRGLEFAVGIPGSLGGGLASNAGAYRSAVSEFITELEVVHGGERKWVEPVWMNFRYRDSRLRNEPCGATVVLRVRMQVPAGDAWLGYQEAREYQRQRISKQPAQASAGSFFKNVTNFDLAQRLPGLLPPLKERGVIPSGFLIEAVGLKGYRLGGASIGERHANFIVNLGGASAAEIRRLANIAKETVHEVFGVTLEEEVLYIGDWRDYAA